MINYIVITIITIMMNFCVQNRLSAISFRSRSRGLAKVYIQQISQHRLSHVAEGAKALLDSRTGEKERRRPD
jgi:hypothetical protein